MLFLVSSVTAVCLPCINVQMCIIIVVSIYLSIIGMCIPNGWWMTSFIEWSHRCSIPHTQIWVSTVFSAALVNRKKQRSTTLRRLCITESIMVLCLSVWGGIHNLEHTYTDRRGRHMCYIDLLDHLESVGGRAVWHNNIPANINGYLGLKSRRSAQCCDSSCGWHRIRLPA